MSDEYELPPPAYEASQQELDRKVAIALEASLAVPAPPSHGAIGEDGWEVWDEAAFAAASANSETSGTSSSGSNPQNTQAGRHNTPRAPVLPLHVKKKSAGNAQPEASGIPEPDPGETSPCLPNPYSPSREPSISQSSHSHTLPYDVPSPPPPFPTSRSPVINSGNSREKERPSWYAEAGLGGPSSPSSQPSPSAHRSSELATAEAPVDDTPPPPFTAVGPSLDGPPFEEVMTYSESDSNDSSAAVTRPQSLYPPRPQPSQQRPSHQSLPAPAHSQPLREAGRLGSRPPRAYTQQGLSPRMDFNHAIAYRKPIPEEVHHKPIPVSVNATSFYNSAVIGHLTSSQKQPVPIRHYSTNTTQSSYDPQPQPAPQSQTFDGYAAAAPTYPQQQQAYRASSGSIPHPSQIPQYPPNPGRWS